jgi:hypothetical protein
VHFRRKENSSSLHQVFVHQFKNSWISQLKRLTSASHHMELVKQVAIASLKTFGITDDCMRVLVPIAHNAHHHNEPDICSEILFFNDECIANMHHMILIGRL